MNDDKQLPLVRVNSNRKNIISHLWLLNVSFDTADNQ
jgi:hypothetical protein